MSKSSKNEVTELGKQSRLWRKAKVCMVTEYNEYDEEVEVNLCERINIFEKR